MMKDIYELINDMDIDENEFEEMEISELERAKVKKAVMSSIRPRKRRWTTNAAAALILVGLSSAFLGMAFPAYANSIPVIDNIFRFLDMGRSGLFDHYKEFSSPMNIAEENNGIKITINDAVFDGETVFLTYSLESDQDLGARPIVHGLLDMKGADGVAGSNQISKIGNNKYVGLMTGTSFSRDKDREIANIKWNIESIGNQDSKEQKITGGWNFALKLKATESSTQRIDRCIERDGVTIHLNKITVTPMSFIIYYDQAVDQKVRTKWDAVDIGIKVKDDLGIPYSGQGNGGAGDKEGYHMSWSKTFEKLDPQATKLIITPQLSFYNYTSANHGSVEMTRDGADEENKVQHSRDKDREEVVLEDIIVELKK